MNEPRCLMGIDGGGSKTAALLADETGRVLGRGAAGASNFQIVGHEAAQAAIVAAMAAATAAAGMAPQPPLSALCIGLSGVDRPGERVSFQQWAAALYPAARVLIANDAELVLAAGTPQGWGLALICGTGAIVYGRSLAGQTARADGWGHLLGDEGSGYAIGLAALRAVMRAYDFGFVFPQLRCDKPFGIHQSLFADPFGWNFVFMRITYFNIIAENIVERYF